MLTERTEGQNTSAHEDEIRYLKRSFYLKERDFANEKAILEQKIELLQLELSESKDRELKTRQHYETLTDILNKPDKRAQETDALVLEGCEVKARFEQTIAEQEERIKLLETLVREKENEVSFMRIEFERKEIALERGRLQVDNEKKEFERRLRKGEDDRETIAERMAMTIEKLKIDHAKELDNVRIDCEKELQEVVAAGQKEREKLAIKVEGLLKRTAVTKEEQCYMHELNEHLQALQKHSIEEVALLKKERDIALKKIEKLEKAVL